MFRKGHDHKIWTNSLKSMGGSRFRTLRLRVGYSVFQGHPRTGQRSTSNLWALVSWECFLEANLGDRQWSDDTVSQTIKCAAIDGEMDFGGRVGS